jgi:hypothetical protein
LNGKGRRENGDPGYLGGIISLELLRKNNAGIREISAPDDLIILCLSQAKWPHSFEGGPA